VREGVFHVAFAEESPLTEDNLALGHKSSRASPVARSTLNIGRLDGAAGQLEVLKHENHGRADTDCIPSSVPSIAHTSGGVGPQLQLPAPQESSQHL